MKSKQEVRNRATDSGLNDALGFTIPITKLFTILCIEGILNCVLYNAPLKVEVIGLRFWTLNSSVLLVAVLNRILRSKTITAH